MDNCPYCGNSAAQAVCVCGFPHEDSREEKYRFLYMKSLPLKTDMRRAEKGIKIARGAMLVGATLLLIAALFTRTSLLMSEEEVLIIRILSAFGGIALGVLAFLVQKHPAGITIAALCITAFVFLPSLIGIALVAILGYGVWCAVRLGKLTRIHEGLMQQAARYAE